MTVVERYLELALRIGRHDDELVEAYHGPPDIKARVAAEAPSRIVGSAAQAIADRLPSGAPAPLRVDPRDAPDIVWVARMGAVLPEGQSPPKPQYLRAPDAQPQNAAQQSSSAPSEAAPPTTAYTHPKRAHRQH